MTARVRGVIAASTASRSISPVPGSLSTRTGVAPLCSTAFAEATKVIAGRITSAVQDDTQRTFATPTYSSSARSKRATFGPVPTQPLRIESATSAISASPIDGLPKTRRLSRPGRRLMASARQRRAVVQLLDGHGAGGRGVEAESAEHALVDVLVDDGDLAALLGVDVDRADLGQLACQRRVVADLVRDLDVDEDAGHQATVLSASLRFTASGISSIRSTTGMPAASRRAIFSVAVSSLPSTIVPAWPKDMPFISSSSMKRPAMKATIGRRESFSATHSASWASMRPPGSV